MNEYIGLQLRFLLIAVFIFGCGVIVGVNI